MARGVAETGFSDVAEDRSVFAALGRSDGEGLADALDQRALFAMTQRAAVDEQARGRVW
jgi:hypothetical protein